MVTVITTVGTSLFENFLKQNNSIENNYQILKEKSFSEWNDNIRAINPIKNNVRNFVTNNADASAEIKSLLKIKNEYDLKDKQPKELREIFEVHLICTDTILSKLAATIIKENLGGILSIKSIEVIKGLSLKSYIEFEEKGVSELIINLKQHIFSIPTKFNKEVFEQNIMQELDYWVDKNWLKKRFEIPERLEDGIVLSKENVYIPKKALSNHDKKILRLILKKTLLKNDEIILNITGGYKALIPFLTIFSQLYSLPCYYIYEESDELLSIPQFPFNFNLLIAEQYYPVLKTIDKGNKIVNANNVFTTLGNNEVVENKAIEELKNLHLIRVNEFKIKLTPIGKLFIDYITDEFSLAENVLGFFVEYKLYEFFHLNIYQSDRIRFPNIFRSQKVNDGTNFREIDLILQSDLDYSKPFVVIESKSFMQLNQKNSFDKLKEQVEGQLNIFRNKKRFPIEYQLIFYRLKYNNPESIRQNLKILKNLVKEKTYSKTNFRPFYFNLILSTRDAYYSNIYQQFLAEPIEELIEIKL